MTLLEAIAQRHSVRRYTDQPLTADQIDHLNALIDTCNQEGHLHLQLVTDEPRAFSSWMVHYGAFSGVRNYIALVGPKADDLDERIGYYGERLVLEAQRMGLHTCWVALTYRKVANAFTVNPGERLRSVIAIGQGVDGGHGHKVKTIDKVARWQGTMPQWFRQGVEAALLAPTAINQQKFRFTLHDGDVVEATHGLGPYAAIDLGIVKLHFELGAAPHPFTWQ